MCTTLGFLLTVWMYNSVLVFALSILYIKYTLNCGWNGYPCFVLPILWQGPYMFYLFFTGCCTGMLQPKCVLWFIWGISLCPSIGVDVALNHPINLFFSADVWPRLFSIRRNVCARVCVCSCWGFYISMRGALTGVIPQKGPRRVIHLQLVEVKPAATPLLT